jgi:hypothetical protein
MSDITSIYPDLYLNQKIMMMCTAIRQKTFYAAIVLAGIVFFTACKKGEVGPQGAPGTANVKYSDWFQPDAYTATTIFGIKHFTYDKTAPDITQQVLDSGMVVVFGKLLGYNATIWPTTQVSQLPIALTYIQGGATNTDTWSALTTPQKLTIRFINDQNDYNTIATNHQFRYVIVPGGSKISARRASLQYGQMSYSDICKLLQIAE